MDKMDTSTGVESHLANLRGVSFDDLRSQEDALEPYRQDLLHQIERPRVNIGSGPPGRAD
jgi:hypothetical protein